MTDLEQKLKADLNNEQFNAAMHMKDPAVVISGAGSGKTHTLISRIEHLIDEGVNPERVVMLTFTNAAADEMKYRASQINDQCQKIIATTYHKYCSMILRKYGSPLGIGPGFETLTPAKYKTLIEYVKSSNPLYDTLEGFPSNTKLDTIFSVMINCGISLKYLITETSYEGYENEIMQLFNEVKAYGLANQQLNFDDLLVYMNKLLNIPYVCKAVAESFDYLMVDEFQDTNSLQLKILNKLGEYNKNLMIVGDISQSIYKFRGAQAVNISNFIDTFNPALYTLNLNYRSTQEILDLANSVMNTNKISWTYVDMVSNNKHGNKPKLIYHTDAFDQANSLIDIITEYQLAGVPLHEIAIIERKSMNSFKLENELTKMKIPFEKRGGMKFTDYACVDDIISFLTIVVNKANKFEWFNVLKLIPGIGNKTATVIAENIDNIEQFSKKKYYLDLMDLMHYVEDWQKLSDLDALFNDIVPYYFELRRYKIENSKSMTQSAKFDALDKVDRDEKIIRTLQDMAANYTSVKEFLEDIALDTLKSKEMEPGERLVITTIHSAKGLEWQVVIIIDCLDLNSSVGTKDTDREEELRCWYVAMTRAKDELIFSVPKTLISSGYLEKTNINPVMWNSLSYLDIFA